MGYDKPLVPYRALVAVLGGLGCTLLYVLRSNLSVAIIAMVDEKAILEDKGNMTGVLHDVCFDFGLQNTTKESHYRGTYKWSESVQGIILGSYFYGYSSTQLVGAYADRFGAKWISALGVMAPAVCNALIPVLAEVHYSLVIVMRVLMGAFHALLYASLFSMFSRWFADSEKNIACSCTTIFGNIGGIITMPIAGYLVKVDLLDGWPLVFYVTSLVHLIWFAAWCIFVTDNPEDNARISETELKYILNNNTLAKSGPKKHLKIPWKSIITSKVVWASIAVKFTGNFSYFLLCSNMPQYLDTVFGMDIETNSWFNSLMYLIACIALSSGGPISQWVKRKGWFSQTRNRKNFQSFAMFGCAICLLLVPVVGCNRSAAVALLLVGMFIYGFITGGEYGVISEYAPAFAGTVFGVANTLAATTGFIGPMLIGYLLDHGDGSVRKQWNIVWYLSAGVYVFGGLVYEIFGSAEPQPWGVANHDDSEDNKNKNKQISLTSDHVKISF